MCGWGYDLHSGASGYCRAATAIIVHADLRQRRRPRVVQVYLNEERPPEHEGEEGDVLELKRMGGSSLHMASTLDRRGRGCRFFGADDSSRIGVSVVRRMIAVRRRCVAAHQAMSRASARPS